MPSRAPKPTQTFQELSVGPARSRHCQTLHCALETKQRKTPLLILKCAQSAVLPCPALHCPALCCAVPHAPLHFAEVPVSRRSDTATQHGTAVHHKVQSSVWPSTAQCTAPCPQYCNAPAKRPHGGVQMAHAPSPPRARCCPTLLPSSWNPLWHGPVETWHDEGGMQIAAHPQDAFFIKIKQK